MNREFTKLVAALALCACASASAGFAAPPAAPPITVFAAASLTNVLQDLAARYEKMTGTRLRLSFAASSMLARQIEAGAGADLFFSADTDWMDYLQSRNLIQKASRRDVISNTLVLIAPRDSTLQLKIAANFALAAALGSGRLAMGDPDSVPAGRYARSALISLGVWGAVADRLVRADNVRSALIFVARGEAPLGIVYGSDAQAEPAVRVVDTFAATSHPAIIYPLALTANAAPGALAFVNYIAGPQAQTVFLRHGFTSPGRSQH